MHNRVNRDRASYHLYISGKELFIKNKVLDTTFKITREPLVVNGQVNSCGLVVRSKHSGGRFRRLDHTIDKIGRRYC